MANSHEQIFERKTNYEQQKQQEQQKYYIEVCERKQNEQADAKGVLKQILAADVRIETQLQILNRQISVLIKADGARNKLLNEILNKIPGKGKALQTWQRKQVRVETPIIAYASNVESGIPYCDDPDGAQQYERCLPSPEIDEQTIGPICANPRDDAHS